MQIPANVSEFYSIIIPVAMFDVLDADWTTQLVFEFDEEGQENLSGHIPGQMADLGYETHNAMLNLGSLAIFSTVWVLQVPFLFISYCLKSKMKIMKRTYKYLKKSMMFGSLIALLIDACFEFLISGYLQLKHPLFSKSGESTSFYIAIGGLTMVLGFLQISFVYMLVKPLKSV